jgi:hypothetical protein
MIQKIFCWLGLHGRIYQDERTGVYLHTIPFYFSGRVKCEYCGKKLEETSGFTHLMYKGIPIIERDCIPTNKVGFLNDKTGMMQILDIKTKKVTKVFFGKLK